MERKLRRWLLPGVLVLFLLEVFLLPFALGLTYSGRSESPHHILTYTTGKLTWDSATGIDENGSALLSLFSESYQNVQSDNGDSVVAPGTENTCIVRLKNNVDRTIRYIAVMYRVKEEETLPVEPILADNEAFTDVGTASCPLPDGVERNQVVRAVTGTVAGDQIQDFDLSWYWTFYENDARDTVDTALGDKAAFFTADEVTAGLYIVVEEDNDPVDPGDPDDPGEPEDPGDPDGPGDPDDPSDPSDPDDPDDPDGPGDPGDPGDPDDPDDPDGPGDPSDPGDPDDPDDPDGPGDPSTPGDPDDPNTPDDPDNIDGSFIYPDVPKTGDDSQMLLYVGMMAVSGFLLVLLIVDRRREEKEE